MHSATASAWGGEGQRSTRKEISRRGPQPALHHQSSWSPQSLVPAGFYCLLLWEPHLLPSIYTFCPQPSALWGPPRLVLGHMEPSPF